MIMRDVFVLLAIALFGAIVFVVNLHLAKKLSFP